ncbi:hypothetical protein [Pseudoalteromonas galatheae]|uniref:hypothetical protein n=1 Tax=Pseudoalteromonas galatheae TaxID=579562 RepID=UPI0030CE98FC
MKPNEEMYTLTMINLPLEQAKDIASQGGDLKWIKREGELVAYPTDSGSPVTITPSTMAEAIKLELREINGEFVHWCKVVAASEFEFCVSNQVDVIDVVHFMADVMQWDSDMAEYSDSPFYAAPPKITMIMRKVWPFVSDDSEIKEIIKIT